MKHFYAEQSEKKDINFLADNRTLAVDIFINKFISTLAAYFREFPGLIN